MSYEPENPNCLLLMAKFGTDTGLFWWEGPEISHGYKLNIKSKYGRDTIPYTAIDGMLILSPQDPLSISAPSNFARLSVALLPRGHPSSKVQDPQSAEVDFAALIFGFKA